MGTRFGPPVWNLLFTYFPQIKVFLSENCMRMNASQFTLNFSIEMKKKLEKNFTFETLDDKTFIFDSKKNKKVLSTFQNNIIKFSW